MNRRILIQVTTPAVVIGLLLLGACLASAWYINRLQTSMARLLSQNVASVRAAHQLEMSLRQLRFHAFLYLVDPRPDRLGLIEEDQQAFEEGLQLAREASTTPEEGERLEQIEAGYGRYRAELDQLQAQVAAGGPRMDFEELAEHHPIRHLVAPCRELSRINEAVMDRTAEENAAVSGKAQAAMVLLGVLGPASGLLAGYGIARGLSRSIYRLSVRVQDVAQRLDQDVASVSVAADGDLANLDRHLGYIVGRVEAVAERLHQQQRELLRAEQLAAVGQLAASVAHEVRNPLTAVKLLVEAALRSHNRKPLTGEDLQVIHGEVARLEQTVQQLLDFARPPAPQRSRCDLREVVGQALDLVRTRARQQEVETACRCPAVPVPAEVDRGQWHTVLVNLFLNALDAMPRGGRLEVALEAARDGVCLRVSDTGSGIPPEMQGRLFTPFASSKPTGTGLGLSISRRIVEEHGGRLVAENRPGGGACFTITLPAGTEPPPA